MYTTQLVYNSVSQSSKKLVKRHLRSGRREIVAEFTRHFRGKIPHFSWGGWNLPIEMRIKRPDAILGVLWASWEGGGTDIIKVPASLII